MYFVVGDVHGCRDELEEILRYWNKEDDTLILLGDLTDKGPDSLGCLRLAMELDKNESVVVLGGNHEDEFIQWLSMKGKEDFYYLSTFDNTIRSFFSDEPSVLFKYTKQRIAEEVKKLYPDILRFMEKRPVYFETKKLLFAHAGCNGKADWKDTAENDCRYIGHSFIYGKNETGKKIIFGHTPTENMNKDGSNDIWISPCGTKIGIDGGCVYGGQLNAIRIDEQGNLIDVYSVKKIKKNH